jgi:two-component system nitrogen regulation response regulator NtrX
MFPTVLIVDDEPSILQSLGGLLMDEGFEVVTALNGYEALKIVEAESPDLVLLDIWMPGIDGIETLKEIKKDNPHVQVIIITGHGTIETAVQATKLGAFDLIEKPLSIDKVILGINNALNFRRLEEENKYLRRKTIEKHSITGSSPPVRELKKQIAAAAPSETWILIGGENGTGKELVARNIHQLSARAERPLIDVSCAAIPEDLIESELFGHEKGAFPGANSKKRGKFELADNGTLFLDEIGDMNLKTQAKILRVLQERQFQRLGSDRVIEVDVRVIAATNKNLEEEIEKGNFREELYYRLNVVPIRVPTLKERIEDLPLLVETFLEEYARKSRGPLKTVGRSAMDVLMRYSWPGNVRELKNLVERLTLMVPGETIGVGDLPDVFRTGQSGRQGVAADDLFAMDRLQDALAAFEKEFVRRKLIENDQDADKTAAAIGARKTDLRKWLKKRERAGR